MIQEKRSSANEIGKLMDKTQKQVHNNRQRCRQPRPYKSSTSHLQRYGGDHSGRTPRSDRYYLQYIVYSCI